MSSFSKEVPWLSRLHMFWFELAALRNLFKRRKQCHQGFKGIYSKGDFSPGFTGFPVSKGQSWSTTPWNMIEPVGGHGLFGKRLFKKMGFI